MGAGEAVPWGLFYEGSGPIQEAPCSGPQLLPEPDPTICKVRIAMWELGSVGNHSVPSTNKNAAHVQTLLFHGTFSTAPSSSPLPIPVSKSPALFSVPLSHHCYDGTVAGDAGY